MSVSRGADGRSTSPGRAREEVLTFLLIFCSACKGGISGMAMLGSNLRTSLPCGGSTIVSLRFLEIAKCLQMTVFLC
jgi:hypothetical protein